MELKFYGGAGCVTGSCHILSVKNKNILLDCGMYQGKLAKDGDNETFDFEPKEIDYVIVTHSHIDHCGRIPLLYKKGFRGSVLCTEATKDLCEVMLADSGHIQEMDADWKNKRRERSGLKEVIPLYTVEDARKCMSTFKGYVYDKYINLFEGFSIRFQDAGHLMGSAIVEIFIKDEEERDVKVVYSGDLGNINVPLLNDPTIIEYADYVIMESTYGNRVHENPFNELNKLVSIIKDTFHRGGNVIIPSFAVGRTQEVLYTLNKQIEDNQLQNIRVFVDSPLSLESTKIFEKYSKNYDREARELIKQGDDPLKFRGLEFIKSVEDSVALNKIKKQAIIISASGMCEAGRIKHHLKHNLWRKECSIVFVGYQAEGTLGRSILQGRKFVRILGEDISIKAEIHTLQGLSGHADRNGLYKWIESFAVKPKKIMLVHGDNEGAQSFKELLIENGYEAEVMERGGIVKI